MVKICGKSQLETNNVFTCCEIGVVADDYVVVDGGGDDDAVVLSALVPEAEAPGRSWSQNGISTMSWRYVENMNKGLALSTVSTTISDLITGQDSMQIKIKGR